MREGLVEFRKLQNFSQGEMAKAIGVSMSYYSKIESGVRNPSYNFIQKFKNSFGADIDTIFFIYEPHVKCSDDVKV